MALHSLERILFAIYLSEVLITTELRHLRYYIRQHTQNGGFPTQTQTQTPDDVNSVVHILPAANVIKSQ